MNKRAEVPAPAVRRLSLYLRELEAILAFGQSHTISSRELGEKLGLTDAQVRKDLAYFGQFGQPGVGYDVEDLGRQIRAILGTDRIWNVLLVGAGFLGTALLSYRGFGRKGFQVVAVLDSDPGKIGKRVGPGGGWEILGMDQLPRVIAEKNVRMAIITVPADFAQAVTDQLTQAGVRGILNFAPVAITAPSSVHVVSVDLATRLEQLAYYVSAQDA